MCIGFYLICIGERDVAFRNQYKLHARQWMDSWQCTALRLVAVTTSEVCKFTFIVTLCSTNLRIKFPNLFSQVFNKNAKF